MRALNGLSVRGVSFGKLLLREGRKQEALQALRRAVYANASDLEALEALAPVMQQMGDEASSRFYYQAQVEPVALL
jgi:Flp pilus assembly protein TadD